MLGRFRELEGEILPEVVQNLRSHDVRLGPHPVEDTDFSDVKPKQGHDSHALNGHKTTKPVNLSDDAIFLGILFSALNIEEKIELKPRNTTLYLSPFLTKQ